MFLPYVITCAGAILRPWAGEGRSRVAGTTREPFDEPTTQKRPALRVACGRAPASLRRSTDVPASLFAARLADRLARTQRRLFPYGRTCSDDLQGNENAWRGGKRKGRPEGRPLPVGSQPDVTCCRRVPH